MVNLNFASRKPIYEQIYDSIVKQATLGILSPSEKLPPVRTLATELGINPNTVSKAYSLLERDGYIYSAVGRGSFISENLDSIDMHKKKALDDFVEATKNARNAGITIESLNDKLSQVYTEVRV